MIACVMETGTSCLLDDDIVSHIVLQYYLPTGKDSKPNAQYYDHEDHVLPSVNFVKAGKGGGTL